MDTSAGIQPCTFTAIGHSECGSVIVTGHQCGGRQTLKDSRKTVYRNSKL